jgi:hypothetical protein
MQQVQGQRHRFNGSETGQLTPLFNPRVHRWDEHYRLHDGEILGLTAMGRVTVRLLQMNRPARIKERLLLRR